MAFTVSDFDFLLDVLILSLVFSLLTAYLLLLSFLLPRFSSVLLSDTLLFSALLLFTLTTTLFGPELFGSGRSPTSSYSSSEDSLSERVLCTFTGGGNDTSFQVGSIGANFSSTGSHI